MKTLAAFTLMLLSTGIFAQTVTVVLVSPVRPVDCKLADLQTVNWIYQLQTIREDSDTAQVQFVTQSGSCVAGRTVARPVDAKWATAFAQQNGNVWPWQKEGVKTSITAYSENEVLVSMKFDKRVLFKKKDENHLTYSYQPGDLFPAQWYRDRNGNMQVWQPRVTYQWNIDLYLDGEIDGQNALTLKIR